jgi:hypothetical protein
VTGPEHPFESTTWGFKRVKITPPAEGQGAAAAGVRSRRRLGKADMRRRQVATIQFRGGEECWVEIQARGQVWRFPGYTAVYDVLRIINRQ